MTSKKKITTPIEQDPEQMPTVLAEHLAAQQKANAAARKKVLEMLAKSSGLTVEELSKALG